MQSPEEIAISLFHEAARRVPAYKQFLKEHKIRPSSIKTIEDFKSLPTVDKKNYLTKYPLQDLCWDGDAFSNQMVSVSSGSTGEPFFWPRGERQDIEGADMHERIYRDIFQTDKKSTLVVVCFSMGTWIAGTFTTACTVEVARRGYKINTITPGLEKEEILKTIKNLAPKYDQLVLAGYPPFIKDVIDEGARDGIKWKKLHTRFLWAGEAFSEEWRSYVLRLVGSKNPCFDSVNIYGTADAAMLGHETPISVMLRRIYNRNMKQTQEVFGTDILPSIVQYHSDKRYFEELNGELVFTANAGIPLIRYNIHDTGGVLPYEALTEPVRKTFDKELAKCSVNEQDWQLPFVYLNGRKDFTVTIYAVNIYPENIKAALVDPKMRSWVTGRFTMATKYRSDMDQYFEVNVELAKGVDQDDDYQSIAENTIVKTLMKLNGEFNKLHNAIDGKAAPIIHLVKYGDPDYFAQGVKHRWVKKV